MGNNNLPAIIQATAQQQAIVLSDVNLMLPTQTYGNFIGEYDRLSIEVIQIDPNPHNGEVFKIGDNLSLGKVAIDKIGSALGIMWDPAQTCIIESTDRKSRAKATGILRKPNGENIIMTEEKTVDLDAIEEEQRIAIEEKALKGNFNAITKWSTSQSGKKYPSEFEPWKSEQEKHDTIELAVRKAMIQYRKFKDERAMTGARERCIRALIAMKSSFSESELQKPFAFPRVTLDTGKMLRNPELRQAAIDRMTGGSRQIFGNDAEDNAREIHGTPARHENDINCRIVSGDDSESDEGDNFNFPQEDPEIYPMAQEYDDLRI